ncbi:MAG: MFS transporter [Sulfobacillus acidophilus]|uniref:MFS transporter n=1 Tax=Sulfobacillus acidophilus TaxID=53633 RepID=A0A2T2WNB8_9FIRM|nr:MAG: MFS transporter [Sulfobacillus acidophilus]
MMGTESELGGDILARLDRIPIWPYPRILLVMIGIGYFFALFDVTNIGFTLPIIAKQFHVTAAVASVAFSTGLVGYVAGALITSTIGDYFGRRYSLGISFVLVGVGSLAAGLSPSMLWLDVSRFVAGMGIAGALDATTPYITELAPAKIRGRYAGWASMYGSLAVAVVPPLALLFVPHYVWGWRAMLAIPVVAVVSVLIGFRLMVESPRWLVHHGRFQEAQDLVATLEVRARQRVGELPPTEPSMNGKSTENRRFSWAALLNRKYGGILAAFIGFWIFFLAADYSWFGLGPTLLVMHGFSIAATITFWLAASAGYIVAAFVAPVISDLWERKWWVATILTILMVSTLLVGVAPRVLVIYVSTFLLASGSMIFTPLAYTLTVEHFPAEGRNSALAASDGVGHIGAALAPAIILGVAGTGNFFGAWFAMAIGFLIAIVFVLLFARRMSRRSLETLEL